jgi:hypothetical protein
MNMNFMNNEMMLEGLKQIGFFFVLWNIFYVVVHNMLSFSKNRKTELDIKNRCVSIVHGTLSFVLSTIFILHFGINFDFPNNILSMKLVSLSLGYFLYDLIACLWFGIWDSKLILHHILAISGFFCPFVTGTGIFSGIIGLFMAEASNFPMHFRVILKQMGLRHTKIYEMFDTMYLVIYIVARGLMCPVFCTMALLNKSTPLMVKFVFVGLTLQSWHFIFIMFSILKKKMMATKERKSKGVQLFWLSVNPRVSELDYVNKGSRTNIF